MKTNLFPPDKSREFGDFDEMTGEALPGQRRAAHFTDPRQPTKSGFDENIAVPRISLIKASPVYGLIPANFRTFTGPSGGSVSVGGSNNNEFVVSSGTALFDYGALQSFRSINAEYGDGIGVRFGARFPDAQAFTWQGAGLGSVGDEVSFGLNGASFGVWHRYNGRAESRYLELTTGAGGAETATVTLNGTAFDCPITAGTVQQNAKEIVDYLAANATNYGSYQVDDRVYIIAKSAGAQSGTWSYSSTGTSAGSFTQQVGGNATTNDFVAQANFNGIVPDGFDHTKGNNYQIVSQGGYGNIKYYIFDSSNGQWVLAHTVLWQSIEEAPTFRNPSMRALQYAYALTNVTGVTNYVSFFDGFIEGERVAARNPRATDSTKTVSTSLTNIMTIQNRESYNGYVNQAEIIPRYLALANNANREVKIYLYGNPTVAGTPNFQELGNNLISLKDTAGTTISGGRYLTSFIVPRQSAVTIDLRSIDIRVPPTLRLVVAGQTFASTAEVTASLTWSEDI